MMDPVRFALVGCGRIGRWHARGLARLPDTSLVAVTDSDAEALAALAREFGADPCRSLESLLRRSDVDVVIVATPPAGHAAIGEAAAAAGKHVLIEKPLALSPPFSPTTTSTGAGPARWRRATGARSI